MADDKFTSGISGFDEILNGILAGDNIVFHIEAPEHYRPFVAPYCTAARRAGQRLVYFRFAGHPPLVGEADEAEEHVLDPAAGFEAFVAAIHRVIEEVGQGGYYLFDCLSELAEVWLSDQMLANFFVLTCPYLYDMGAVAYFGLRRYYHTVEAVGTIRDTAQVHVDLFVHKGELFVRPTKAQQRHSPTMYLLHRRHDERFLPVYRSDLLAEIMAPAQQAQARPPWLKGVWNRAFLQAANDDAEDDPALCARLLRMALSRDERVLELARRYFGVRDLTGIRSRMVGSGLIGGKAVGMLLARKMLVVERPELATRLEPHDSFFIGSDVYYTFLVRNGIWWTREQQRDVNAFLDGSHRARQRIVVGSFPEHIMEEFQALLDYFGQSPIIVRSSSLLEDNFGNAFAGKYESVFCANQGPRERRLEDFLSAVRTIYASTMSRAALTYRAKRGLLGHDEQMGLLVQRVSGSVYGEHFFPQAAGVGFSFNPYAWSDRIDPRAGVLRLVFGLGTRAVDRVEDDYIRVVALNAPQRRPESPEEGGPRAQWKLDVIDLHTGHHNTVGFRQVLDACRNEMPLEIFASRDRQVAQASGREAPLILDFACLLHQTDFVATMRGLLGALEDAYAYPVDVEFTVNFDEDKDYRINLVQCRPLQIMGGGRIEPPPADLPAERVVFRARGAVVGQSRIDTIDRLVWVRPEAYSRLSQQERYAVARLIGRFMGGEQDGGPTTVLMGPGRWGTSTPSLGVPVSYSEVSAATALCEIAAMHEGLIPDVSLGTHFFNEIVEQDILYFAIFPERDGNDLNREVLDAWPSSLLELVPDAGGLDEVVRVLDADQLPADRRVRLYANPIEQIVLCYLDPNGGSARF